MCSVGSTKWTWPACFATVLKPAYTLGNISGRAISDVRFLRALTAAIAGYDNRLCAGPLNGYRVLFPPRSLPCTRCSVQRRENPSSKGAES